MFAYSILLFLTLLSFNSFAGFSEDLCDTVRDSQFIVEVQIDGKKGNYPEKYKLNKWTPEQTELSKVEKSAKIIKVIKGNYSQQQVNEKTYFLNFVNQSAEFWDQFFKTSSIKTILADDSLYSWIIDNHPDSYSLQPGYQKFKKEINSCLKEK